MYSKVGSELHSSYNPSWLNPLPDLDITDIISEVLLELFIVNLIGV